jgi:hypothetical protein
MWSDWTNRHYAAAVGIPNRRTLPDDLGIDFSNHLRNKLARPAKEFPAPIGAGARCYPAQIGQVRAGGIVLRGFQPLPDDERHHQSTSGRHFQEARGAARFGVPG